MITRSRLEGAHLAGNLWGIRASETCSFTCPQATKKQISGIRPPACCMPTVTGGRPGDLRLRWAAGEATDRGRPLYGILLDAGSNDDYNLHWGQRLLSHHLREAGIADEHRGNSGNHGGRAFERYQVALEWLSQVLEGD